MVNEIYDYDYPEDGMTYYRIVSDDNAEFEIGHDPGWEISIALTTSKSKLYHATVTKSQLQDLHKLLSHFLDNIIGD